MKTADLTGPALPSPVSPLHLLVEVLRVLSRGQLTVGEGNWKGIIYSG